MECFPIRRTVKRDRFTDCCPVICLLFQVFTVQDAEPSRSLLSLVVRPCFGAARLQDKERAATGRHGVRSEPLVRGRILRTGGPQQVGPAAALSPIRYPFQYKVKNSHLFLLAVDFNLKRMPAKCEHAVVKGPKGKQRYNCTLSLTSTLDGVGGQRHAPAALPPGEIQYPLYRRLGGPQGRSGQARKISPPTGIRSPDRPARSVSLYRLSYPSPHKA